MLKVILNCMRTDMQYEMDAVVLFMIVLTSSIWGKKRLIKSEYSLLIFFNRLQLSPVITL